MEPNKPIVKITFVNSLSFLKSKTGEQDLSALLKKDSKYEQFALQKKAGEYTKEPLIHYQANSQEDVDAFLKVVVGLTDKTPSVFGAITGIHYQSGHKSQIVDHFTKANARITVFAKPVGKDEWAVYGIGFHTNPGGISPNKGASAVYKLDHYWQPDTAPVIPGSNYRYTAKEQINLAYKGD